MIMKKHFFSEYNKNKLLSEISHLGVAMDFNVIQKINQEMENVYAKFDNSRAKEDRVSFYVNQFNNKVLERLKTTLSPNTHEDEETCEFDEQFAVDTSLSALVALQEKQDTQNMSFDDRFKRMTSERDQKLLPSELSEEDPPTVYIPNQQKTLNVAINNTGRDVVDMYETRKTEALRAKREYLDAMVFKKIVVDTRLLPDSRINSYSVLSCTETSKTLYFINIKIPTSKDITYVDFYINGDRAQKINVKQPFVPFKVDLRNEIAVKDLVFAFFKDNENVLHEFEEYHIMEFMAL